MIDADAVNDRLAGSGWAVAVEEDTTVGGSVLVAREQRTDPETGAPLYDDRGDPVMDEVHEHVGLEAPVQVIVARRGDEEHRFSPLYDDAEVLIALWDHDVEQERLAAHDRGEHTGFRADCQRCHEDRWARDAADDREQALYGGRSDDVVAWLKGHQS